MEDKEIIINKNNTGLIVVLVFLLIGAFGYIGYDKYIQNQKLTQNANTNVNNNTENKTIISSSDELYKKFINNIKKRDKAESVTFEDVESVPKEENGYKHFILGTDNKLYVETYDEKDTKIPGALGSGGSWTGKYINIDNVVRIFKVYHTSSVSEGYIEGLLLIKEDGYLYIIRNIDTDEYIVEKLNNKYIVDAYNAISPSAITYVVDIEGNSFEIK